MEKADFIKWAKKLEASYVPAESTATYLSSIDLLAIVGPTGAGKTTLIDALKLPKVKSEVTRERRPDEKKDDNYHFHTDYLQIMKDLKEGAYAQFTISSSGEFYGTHKNSYPKEGLCVMPVFAHAIEHFRTLGFHRVIPIYIMPPSYVEWMRRIGKIRSGDIDIRIQEAIASIHFALRDPSYFFVLNDNLELALRDIRAILAGELPDEHRASLARDTADVLLERLGDQEDDFYFGS